MSVLVEIHSSASSQATVSASVDGARTVAEAVGMLRLPLRTAVIILVNGRLAGWETTLQDGDGIELLPAVGGG